MQIQIGLASAKESYRDANDEVQFRPVDGMRVLTIEAPDGLNTTEVFSDITRPNGIMEYHTDAPPNWVSCPGNSLLEQLLAEHYGCSQGVPADVEDTYWTDNGPPANGGN